MKKFIIIVIILGLVVAGVVYGLKRHSDKYADKEEISENVTRVIEDGKMSLVDSQTGKVLVGDLDVDWVQCADGDSLAIFAQENKRGVVNLNTGKVVVPATYRRAWVYGNGLAAVEKYGMIGFINTKGEVVIDFKYPFKGNRLSDFIFSNGHCLVSYKIDKEHQRLGVIDTLGNWLIKPEYDDIETFKDHVIVMNNGEFKKMYDYNGNLLHDNLIDEIERLEYSKTFINVQTGLPENSQVLNEDYMAYRVNNNYGLMDKSGRFITKPIYTNIQGVTPTVFRAGVSGYWSSSDVLIDSKGNVLQQIKD